MNEMYKPQSRNVKRGCVTDVEAISIDCGLTASSTTSTGVKLAADDDDEEEEEDEDANDNRVLSCRR